MKANQKKSNTAASQVELDASTRSLGNIAVEAWRLNQAVQRVLTRMDPMDAERFANQYRWFQTKLNGALVDAKLRIVDLTGQPYSVGMAATPLNLDEFTCEELVVAQMVEPIIMMDGHVVCTGKLLLSPKSYE